MNIASLDKWVVSVFPHSAQRGLPIIHAAVLVLEGGTLTAIRTGAASGAATEPLARSDSQLEAVCTARPIQTAWIYDPNLQKTEAFIAETVGRGPIPTDLRVAPDHLRWPLSQLLPGCSSQ